MPANNQNNFQQKWKLLFNTINLFLMKSIYNRKFYLIFCELRLPIVGDKKIVWKFCNSNFSFVWIITYYDDKYHLTAYELIFCVVAMNNDFVSKNFVGNFLKKCV